MRTVFGRVAVLLLPLGCTPVSIQPTYTEDQLVSIPGLDGVWRDSAEGDEIVLSAIDSLSYLVAAVEGKVAGRVATSHLGLRTARRNGVTFVDVVPTSEDDTPQTWLGWHYMPLHGFFLVEAGKDRMALRVLDPDSLKALLRRSPREAAHIVSDDRVVLTGPTAQVQAFLIRTSLQAGMAATVVYRRVPAGSSCEEAVGETLNVGLSFAEHDLLRMFGVQVRRSDDVALLTLDTQETIALESDGLLGNAGSMTSRAPAPVALSQLTPLIVVVDQKNERRLELRWGGVTAGGDVTVRAVNCHDSFPSSQAARDKLRSPVLATRFEGDPREPQLRYAWSRVPGATAYEVQRWGYESSGMQNVKVSDRFVVQDTSIIHPRPITASHNWRVRAYAAGVGFGPLSAVQVVPGRNR